MSLHKTSDVFLIFFIYFFICLMIQNQEKEQEILTMKQHIQILQQEHLAKISHIAELEAQLQYLKVITWSVLRPVV